MKAKTGIIGFIKAACANWTQSHGHNGYCLGCYIPADSADEGVWFNPSGKCLVMEGKRCSYFEQSVLGSSDYRYRLEDWDYVRLFDQYSRINPAYLSIRIKARRCKCGAELQPGKKICSGCRRKRQRRLCKPVPFATGGLTGRRITGNVRNVSESSLLF